VHDDNHSRSAPNASDRLLNGPSTGTSPALTGASVNRIPATPFSNQPSPAASVQGRVLGVEEEIRGVLVEGEPDLYGRVDLPTEDEDTLTSTEIETSRGKWSAEQVEDSGEQLLLYSHLASEIAPGKKIVTRFLVLTKTKEPVVEEPVREVEPAAVKRTLAGVERVWRAIESARTTTGGSSLSLLDSAACEFRARLHG
jgi:hypothetical protein